jgi:probable LLM family oxidoreductase
MKILELGITTFAEVMPNPETNETLSYDERIRQVVEEIELADQVGLDFYGVGEHHREEFAASVPVVILAAAARTTKNIKLGSAVTVLSSEDPVRVYQQFATLNAISNGRAEITAGRGSFIESFPLFGYDLNDYDDLYDDKLRLLVQLRDKEKVSYNGRFRAALKETTVYPQTNHFLGINVAVGGTRASAVRAGELGLPLFLAIIGGNPVRFKPLVDAYKDAFYKVGHNHEPFISLHSHGFILDDIDEALNTYYPSIEPLMTKIGLERGFGRYTIETYKHALSMDGALYVGDPNYVAEKINFIKDKLDLDRFTIHVPVGYMDHDKVLKTIELLGTKVRPLIK